MGDGSGTEDRVAALSPVITTSDFQLAVFDGS
jgi:hypothetical protein